MRKTEKLKKRIDGLTIKQRLTYSNLLMFLIPIAATLITSAGALGIAFYAFKRFYLPRIGLTAKGLHEMGEQYENELKTFLIPAAILFIAMLALLTASIVITNRFLVKFMLKRVEEPLNLLTQGVARVSSGDLGHTVSYSRSDEFQPVFRAFNDMAARLKQSEEQSAGEEQRRRELFAGISHDLRSPLTSVRAYTEALLDGVAKTPEDERRYLDKILMHESEIERMAEALFLYTKMDLKDYPVNLRRLNLKDELSRICRENTCGGHLDIDITGVPDLSVIADSFLLERIILNLLDNSAKYRRGDTAQVRINAERTDGGILVSVSDNGIGVPERLLPRLFDTFDRADPARSGKSGGSGLGLAIVRKAAEHIGGSVWAECVSGGGLCIKLLLREASENGEYSDY